ncbi:hypothetical protein [Luteimonas sp. FCS-9]|uniref:hypothetical protein n=1 Tax=Luteimonas sp. FCS-9 TaxID=1547516 RepID=UPI00063EA79F|nr:hypothetical protein [Luteimonas sp. FCS-9]KLJ01994.1 hypothetical protein WQ56_03870 [Luteimonas sp. FCS-9]
MEFYGIDRARVIGNCDSQGLGRAGSALSTLRAWNRIRPEHVVELLDKADAAVRADARSLAVRLSRMPWHIQRTVAPALGTNRLVSNAREIAIGSAGRTYVLHCTEGSALTLERISA